MVEEKKVNEEVTTLKQKTDALLKAGKNPIGKNEKDITKMYAELTEVETSKTKKVEDVLTPAQIKDGMVAVKVKRNFKFVLGRNTYELTVKKGFQPLPKSAYLHLLRKTDIVEMAKEK